MIFTQQMQQPNPNSAAEFANLYYPSLFQALGFPLRKTHGCLFSESGLNHPFLNGVLHFNPAKHELTKAVEEISRYFKSQRLSHSWWVEKEHDFPERQAALEHVGCKRYENPFYGMVCQLSELPQQKENPSLQIQQITNEADLFRWSCQLCEEFALPEALHQPYADISLRAGFHGPCYHFMGLHEGQLVTTGTLLMQDFGAFIYNISTKKDQRAKGFANQMTQSLLQQASEKGALRVGLISMYEAEKGYQKIGFRRTNEYHLYMHHEA